MNDCFLEVEKVWMATKIGEQIWLWVSEVEEDEKVTWNQQAGELKGWILIEL